MTEKRFFADVDQPFHVWVREDGRWVLRDAASRVQGEVSCPAETRSVPTRQNSPSRPS